MFRYGFCARRFVFVCFFFKEKSELAASMGVCFLFDLIFESDYVVLELEKLKIAFHSRVFRP